MAQTFLIVVLIVLMGLVLYSLVRGIVAFLQTTKEELESENTGPSPSQLMQNKMMMRRILYQGLAVVLVAILLAAAGN